MTHHLVSVCRIDRWWYVTVVGIGGSRASSLAMIERTAIGLIATATTEPLADIRLWIEVSLPAETIERLRAPRTDPAAAASALAAQGWATADIAFVLRLDPHHVARLVARGHRSAPGYAASAPYETRRHTRATRPVRALTADAPSEVPCVITYVADTGATRPATGMRDVAAFGR